MMPHQNPRDPELLTFVQGKGHGNPEHRRRRVPVHNDSDTVEDDRFGAAVSRREGLRVEEETGGNPAADSRSVRSVVQDH